MKMLFFVRAGNFSYAVDERVTVRRNLVTGDLTYITPENCNVSSYVRTCECFTFFFLFTTFMYVCMCI